MAHSTSMLRIFRLIRLLQRKPHKLVAELATLLEVDRRQIYRDLELLEEIGYLIDKDSKNRYFLFLPESDETSLRFTPEESQFLCGLVSNLTSHPFKKSLLQKLYQYNDLLPLADSVYQTQIAREIRKLQEALHQKHLVCLHAYHSVSSGQISDREVQPLHFSEDYLYIKAYELSSNSVKSFKLERIGEVIPLEKKGTYEGEVWENDLFGCTGPKPLAIELLLSHRAYRLLIEEFPPSQAFVTQVEHALPYRALLTVRAFEGVGRFILGLPGEIRVKGPRELQAYLSRKVAMYGREGEVNG